MRRIRSVFHELAFRVRAWRAERALMVAQAEAEIGMLARLQGARR